MTLIGRVAVTARRWAGPMVVATLLLATVPTGPRAGAQAPELVAAREEAARAAEEYTEAEFQAERVQEELARTGVVLAETQAHRDALAAVVAEELIDRYVQGGGVDSPLLAGVDLATRARADALSRAARGRVADQAELLRAADAQLRDQQQLLRRQQADSDAALARAESRSAELRQLLKELEAIEATRAEAERQAEAARRQAEAEAAAAEQARAYEAATSAGSSGSGSGSGAGSGSSATPTAPAPARPVVPVNWLCPITGAYSFSDTWGAARSNGRSHRGTDMFTDYGTPLVAVVSGTAVNYGWESAGGNGVFLLGDDGNRYFYAHLDEFGTLGRVSQGEVIGYAGDTGNATGTPHLHFEIHPGGSGWTNPYGTLSTYC